MRVLITRTPDAAGQLIEELRSGGLRAGIELDIGCAPVHQAVALTSEESRFHPEGLAFFDWVSFTSVNGVLAASSQAMGKGYTLADLCEEAAVRVAAVGAATSRALDNLGVAVDFTPDVADAKHMVAQWQAPYSKVLCVQGRNARPILAEGLEGIGCSVTVAEVYEMQPFPAQDPLVPLGQVPADVLLLSTQDARSQLPEVDALIATAPSLLSALTQDTDPAHLPPVVAIGATTGAAAKYAGLGVLISPTPAPADMAATTLELLIHTKEVNRA